MATIQITSRNNIVSLLEDLIFDFDLAPNDQPLLSKEVKITLNSDYSIPDIEAIQVIEKKIIWADFTVTDVPVDSHQIITEPEKTASLAGFSGSDSVTTYAKRDLDWLCYCGAVNQNTLSICARCHRDASEFPEEGTYSAFIDHLISCETLLEAKELTTVYESTLTQPMFEKLKASIEKDIYIKKVYGMKNEKEKMKIYLAILQSDLPPSVFSDNQSQ